MKLAGRFPVPAAALAALCVGGVLAAAPAPETPPDKLVFTSMSPDGKKIGLFIMNADGSQRTTLTKEGATEIDPALSPDGKHIAFVVVGKDDMKGDLWVMGADGTGRKQLTENKAKTVTIAPSWSPDGKHIAFTRMQYDAFQGPPTDTVPWEIVVTDADGKTEKSVGKGLFPSWSPDGKQMLYTTLDKVGGFAPRLWVMDADGKNAKQLFTTPSMLGAFSPDGKHIAYMGAGAAPATPDQPPRIHVCDPDGANAARVTKNEGGFELSPRWSADGKRIFFSRMAADMTGPQSKTSIFVMDADGGNEKELTKSEGMDMLGGASLFLLNRPSPPKP